MIRIKVVTILNFSVIAIIAKINTKIRIKVVNKIPNNRLKLVCAKFDYRINLLHIGTSSTFEHPTVLISRVSSRN